VTVKHAPPARPVRLAVMISGRGSNMVSLAQAARNADCPYQIALVLANREDAKGLEIAHSMGFATALVPHASYGKDREAHERAVHQALVAADIELVALAGYMRVLTPWFVGQWAGRLVNIHPSLLPLYKGLDTHARALNNGDREAGCSVHWVSEGVDEGAVIAQARVPILLGDTADSLAARVLQAEHGLYPAALQAVCLALQQAKSPPA